MSANVKNTENICNITITTSEVFDIDLTSLCPDKIRQKLKRDFLNQVQSRWFQQHYNLLAYLSTKFNNTTLIEVGTFRGLGALALSYNKTNKVISYDIQNLREINNTDNIEFRIKNIYDDAELILDCPFIFFDAGTYEFDDPDAGKFEKEFYNFLTANKYKGIVLYDDIYLSKEISNFWKNIKQPKHDLSKVGHMYSRGVEQNSKRKFFTKCGSGLIDFSGNVNIVDDCQQP